MRSFQALKVDAFTTEPYTGNPAGVVPDAEGLDERQMQQIAREMNLSETAFLQPPTVDGADVRLRYFTPTSEIKLCGHATVAMFHALSELGRIALPHRARVQTDAGVLDVEVREGPEVWFTSEPMRYAPSPVGRERAAQLLGLDAADVAPGEEPLLLVKEMLFVPLAGLKAMERIEPDLPAIARLHSEAGIDGVVALSFETRASDALTHIRYFVPHVGIAEDPVTGAAHMALGGYLARVGRLDLSEGRASFTGEQGHFVGRPGTVDVEILGAREDPVVRIAGRAVTTLSGEMRVP